MTDGYEITEKRKKKRLTNSVVVEIWRINLNHRTDTSDLFRTTD